MTSANELRTLRRRHDELAGMLDAAPPEDAGSSPSMLALTTTLRLYPTQAQSYFACQPLTLLGPEVEGGPGVITPGAGTFFALNLGSTVPPSGEQVLCVFVGNRWVFRYDA